jgi:hypothetical protein
MFWALLAHFWDYNKLYKTVAWYIGLLHAEELLEILQCRMCIVDRIVRSKLEQLMMGQ